MKCPHCLESFHDDPKRILLRSDVDGGWAIDMDQCPSCKKLIFFLINGEAHDIGRDSWMIRPVRKRTLVRPKGSTRAPAPPQVPREFAEDYTEACTVLPDSPKASAALSRRCLQHLLREIAKVKPGNLAHEIQQVIDSAKLPSHLTDSIDAIRNIGNFATHPIKSEKSREIVPVEPGEAEWNLDVLESLFDFYFVQPAMLERKRQALDKKLEEAGKKKMK